ncbi:MAG: hypothetical protein L6R40_004488 [Gallowayella cf. fulva]|nr:MAG: hypothetical protein L6R40_004488 [Xanthomendoza cf. fulva]
MAQPQSGLDLDYVTIDVFTNVRFKGNPLAIVELPHGKTLDQQTKQKIAREFNFSETVFLHPPDSAPSSRTMDIFTTMEELPFAGHPTIGTLVYLGAAEPSWGKDGTQSITLQTKAGPIKALFNGQTGVAEASIPHSFHIHQMPVQRESVLNVQSSLNRIESSSQTPCPLVSIVRGMTFVLVNVPHVEDLAALTVGGPGIEKSSIRWDEGWESFTVPYFYAIMSEDKEARDIRVRVRMIEPTCGEDPATGSAASGLSAYLALQRGTARSTYNFSVEQGVEMGRHSDIGVKVTLDDAKSVKHIVLSGAAVVVSRGKLYL